MNEGLTDVLEAQISALRYDREAWQLTAARRLAEIKQLTAALMTVRTQADAYLERCRAELPQDEPLWLCETALNHIRDTTQALDREKAR